MCDAEAHTVCDRFTWGIEMTCEIPGGVAIIEERLGLKLVRLHTVPVTTGPN